MSERLLHECLTSSGHKYEMIEYITGGEGRSMGFLASTESSVENQEKLQDLMITTAVKSLDGSSENILERVKDLPLTDYTEIIQETTKLFGGLDDQKKTK